MGLHGQPQDKLAGSCQPGLLRRGRRIRRGDSGFRGSRTVPVAPNAIPDPALSALQAVPARLPPVRRVKRPCQGWYRTLDPNDGRFFDGCSNPEYTDECWEDDMLFSRSSQRNAHRLFTGHQLADLIPEQDDGIQWWED